MKKMKMNISFHILKLQCSVYLIMYMYWMKYLLKMLLTWYKTHSYALYYIPIPLVPFLYFMFHSHYLVVSIL